MRDKCRMNNYFKVSCVVGPDEVTKIGETTRGFTLVKVRRWSGEWEWWGHVKAEELAPVLFADWLPPALLDEDGFCQRCGADLMIDADGSTVECPVCSKAWE